MAEITVLKCTAADTAAAAAAAAAATIHYSLLTTTHYSLLTTTHCDCSQAMNRVVFFFPFLCLGVCVLPLTVTVFVMYKFFGRIKKSCLC